jgi:hypothetical protein
MEKTKLKKSKTLSINTHEIESKAFSKSMRRRIPGMSCSSVKCRTSYIRRVFSPIYFPGMKPVWSLLIRIGRTELIRSAIQLEASLYTVFRRLIDLQFFINFLGFSPFGIQVIMPCFCVIDN